MLPEPAPLAFTSDQLAEVVDAAKRLPQERRGAYLEELAGRLRGRPVHRRRCASSRESRRCERCGAIKTAT
jgi:hypothetical protein